MSASRFPRSRPGITEYSFHPGSYRHQTVINQSTASAAERAGCAPTLR